MRIYSAGLAFQLAGSTDASLMQGAKTVPAALASRLHDADLEVRDERRPYARAESQNRWHQAMALVSAPARMEAVEAGNGEANLLWAKCGHWDRGGWRHARGRRKVAPSWRGGPCVAILLAVTVAVVVLTAARTPTAGSNGTRRRYSTASCARSARTHLTHDPADAHNHPVYWSTLESRCSSDQLIESRWPARRWPRRTRP